MLDFVVFLISGISCLFYFSFPDIESLKRHNPKKTSLWNTGNGNGKGRGRNTDSEKWVPVSQISPYLIKAVLIAEMTSSGAMRVLIIRRCRRLWKKI